jgi:hypothetical protein
VLFLLFGAPRRPKVAPRSGSFITLEAAPHALQQTPLLLS